MTGIKLDYHLVGGEKIREALSKKTITEPLEKAIAKITLSIERETKKATPVGTPESTEKKGYHGGRLRSSITSTFEPTFGSIGTNIPYCTFVEYGTPTMEARHVEEGRRVYGVGMFAYALQQVKEKMGELLKELGIAIKEKFG